MPPLKTDGDHTTSQNAGGDDGTGGMGGGDQGHEEADTKPSRITSICGKCVAPCSRIHEPNAAKSTRDAPQGERLTLPRI